MENLSIKFYILFLVLCSTMTFGQIGNGILRLVVVKLGKIIRTLFPSNFAFLYEKKLLIIDVDTGIDDSYALLMAIKASQNLDFGIKILAITCVAGNTNITNCVQNTHRTLQVMGITNIPVYQGFDEQLVIPCVQDDFHGEDGLGDVNWPDQPDYEILEESAPSMMIKLAETYPGQITLVALGPLTNLAMAAKINPNFAKNLKDVFIMGGNIHGKGNVKISSEFNFYCDPEAASVVLNSYKVPMTIIPLETCEDSYFTCDWRKNIIGGLNTPEAEFVQKIEANLMDSFYCPGPGNDGKYITYDQITLAVLIEPNVILEEYKKYCTVELRGEYTRSMMIVDYSGHLGRNENVRIISKIDMDIYGKMLLWTLGGDEFIKYKNKNDE